MNAVLAPTIYTGTAIPLRHDPRSHVQVSGHTGGAYLTPEVAVDLEMPGFSADFALTVADARRLAADLTAAADHAEGRA
jgi:hypothetical protein